MKTKENAQSRALSSTPSRIPSRIKKSRHIKEIKRNRRLALALVLVLALLTFSIAVFKKRVMVEGTERVVGTMADTLCEEPENPTIKSEIILSAPVQAEEYITEYTTATIVTESTATTTITTKTATAEDGFYSSRLGRMVSNDEMDLLVMITCSEAGVEPYMGKLAVVATILNRIESEDFPNSIYDVIFQEKQFSSAVEGHFYSGCGETLQEITIDNVDKDMLTEARKAVKSALGGSDPTLKVGGALYFYNPTYCSSEELEWRASITEKVQIYEHIFFRVWD